MKTIFPHYYQSFQCIADACRHSCCVGWEIAIDPDTLSYYDSLDGPLASRLQKSIHRGEYAHFLLQEGERCPFLNQKGLCDLILFLGEDALCDICADHPRFRNYHSHSVEIGLGLCCEAACSLILKDKTPFSLLNYDLAEDVYTEEERFFLSLRDECIKTMQDRSLSIAMRHKTLLSRFSVNLPQKSVGQWCDFYLNLERLDPLWTDRLAALKSAASPLPSTTETEEINIALEQLTVYFLYRHLSCADSMEALKQYLCFSVQSVQMIYSLLALCPADVNTLDFLLDSARMYSAEIEYSDQNITALCNLF